MDGRNIRYRALEEAPMIGSVPIPVDERELSEHTLLPFELATDEAVRCERFMDLEIYQARTFDWDLIEAMGLTDRLETLLWPSWRSALRCSEVQYAELTMEFHSTFQYDLARFSEPTAISFALGRRKFTMSVPDFAVATGFYTREEADAPGFAQLLRGQ